MPPLKRYQRIRTLALSAGMVLGMMVATLGPQLAHASKHAKDKVAKAPTFAPLPEASEEQLAAANRVLVGRYECEFNKVVSIDRNDTNKGYFNVNFGKQSWVMKPELSTTGAIRMNDVNGQTLLIQILTKSMILNAKAGQRLVDDCVHEVQRAAEAELARHPRPSMFSEPESAPIPAHALAVNE